MRKYRSHKVVEAAEVTAIGDIDNSTEKRIDTGGTHVFLSGELGNKGCPAVGDFVVRYPDGHVSWSPRKAFLDGYSPIDDTGADYQPEQVHP